MVALWQRVRSGSFEYQSKLSTFIYATAKNIWFRRLARQRRELPAAEDTLKMASGDATPLEDMEENERVLAVQKGMEQIGNPAAISCFFFIGKNDQWKK
jgi:DNA-directed RNA polymerase specialized sigma24 family protein